MSAKASAAARAVLVYAGDGVYAGERKIECLVRSLRAHLGGAKVVRKVKADDILHSDWEVGCDMLCMPGGADLPYCAALNGRGNVRIKRFVEQGGAYLGICAGAYYGSARCEFEEGTQMEVVGERELAFFSGVARGTAYPGFDYLVDTGAHAAPLNVPAWSGGECVIYCNGGSGFIGRGGESADQSSEVLAWYADDSVTRRLNPQQRTPVAAVVRCAVGKGVAVLSGVHPELTEEWLERQSSAPASELARLRDGLAGRLRFWSYLLSTAGLGTGPKL